MRTTRTHSGSRATIIRPQSSRTEGRAPGSAGSCGTSLRWAPSRSPSRTRFTSGPSTFRRRNCRGGRSIRNTSSAGSSGIRDYGNRVGIPTVAGCIVFDEGYLGNIVVNVACVGFGKKSQIVRNRVASEKDVFILAGGRTGRDGIHGVTYASVDLTDKAVQGWESGAVQLGDPILKEPLIHACVESAQAGLLDGLKDL